MKFLVLMTEPGHFDRWDASDDGEQQAVLDAYARFTDAIRTRGAVLYGDAVARPEQARTLQPGDGADRPLTEGPYVDAVEQLGGFYVIEAADLADVTEATRLLPREYSIEIRPLLDVYQGVTWPLRGR
jgi:hypothetical protein